MDVKWKRGEFKTFYAYMKVRIGGKDLPVDAIHQGDTFEYDGTMLRYAGAEFPQPGLRGAVKQNWAGLTSDQTDAIRQDITPRQVAKSQTINRDLSRVQRAGGEAMETDSLDEETVLQVSDRGKIEQKEQPRVMVASNNRRIQMSAEDSQDGVTVGRVRSPARVKADVLDPRNASLTKDIENRGVGKPELFQKEGVTVSTNVGKVSGPVVIDEDQGVTVGRVRHTDNTSTEGVSVKDTSGSAKGKKMAKKSSVKMSPKLRVAMKVFPAFPQDWNFYATKEEKLARIEENSDNPDFLDAVYASESASIKKVLVSNYPNHFAG